MQLLSARRRRDEINLQLAAESAEQTSIQQQNPDPNLFAFGAPSFPHCLFLLFSLSLIHFYGTSLSFSLSPSAIIDIQLQFVKPAAAALIIFAFVPSFPRSDAMTIAPLLSSSVRVRSFVDFSGHLIPDRNA